MSEETLIVGGGLAGLAAGVALASAGKQVRLIEQRPHLGGRARSFRDPVTGSTVDNGQHVIMGCYHETLRFLREIGTLHCVRFEPRLSVRFLESEGHLTSLVCPGLPAPWHLLAGVLASSSFAWHQKLEVLRLGRALDANDRSNGLQGPGARNLTVEQWLVELGQSEPLRRNFWDLLCIAAMNEDPRIASAALFERVLKLALFTSPADSCIGLARGGLSDCYAEAAAAYIRSRGGAVETGRNVAELVISGDACVGVKLADGERIQTRNVISAVPWTQFLQILPAAVRDGDPSFARISLLRPAPIISINLWFDRAITALDFVALRGATIQWLFNKGHLLAPGESPSLNAEIRGYVSLVISGAHSIIGRSKGDLLGTALDDLGRLLPPARKARLLRSLVIKERLATFSPSPEAEQSRPTARTSVQGLYLAGDWTSTGFPATIEGAVRSGYTAAREILRAENEKWIRMCSSGV